VVRAYAFQRDSPGADTLTDDFVETLRRAWTHQGALSHTPLDSRPGSSPSWLSSRPPILAGWLAPNCVWRAGSAHALGWLPTASGWLAPVPPGWLTLAPAAVSPGCPPFVPCYPSLSLIPGLRSLVGPVGIEPATKDS
jgi:hypothetical protein